MPASAFRRTKLNVRKTDLYWHRRTGRIAAPVIITNISIPLLGIADTAVVGRLPGPEYLGAVAIGAMIVQMMYIGTNFLRMGTTGFTAQSFGARDGSEVRCWLWRGALLAVVLSALIVALQVPIYDLGRLILAPSAAVDPLAQSYFEIRIWGAPFALLNLVLLGWFFGIQDTRSALITQVTLNGINIALNILFVIGLGFGVDGVAWATLIAEVCGVALGFFFVFNKLAKFGGRVSRQQILDGTKLKRMFSVNRDIFLRSISVKTAFILLTAIGSRMGDTTLAANAILLQFQTLMAYALDGFATAAEALAGQAKGARSRRKFDAAVRSATLASGVLATIFCVCFALFGPLFIDFLTTVPDVRRTADTYLIWSIVMPLIAVWCYQLDGIFIGCTWSKEMRNSMAMSLLVYIGALALLVPIFDNHGLWAALAVFMAARGITMAWFFRRLRTTIGKSAAS